MSDLGDLGIPAGTDSGFNFPEPTQQPAGQPSPDSLADGFLKNIPERDRNVVAPYIKDWDAGVTRRFQAIHDQYKGYRELGVDLETVQGWKAIAELIDTNPQMVVDYLSQQLQGNQQVPNIGPVGQPNQPQSADPSFSDVPEAFVNRYNQLEQVVMALGQNFLQSQQSFQQAQEDQALDNALASLHSKHGEFDDDSVVVKIARGVNPDKAVQDWQAAYLSKVAQQNRRPVPPVLNGTGGVPSGQIDPSKLSSKDSKSIFAQMLAAAAQQEE